jgi:hypothetical protein
MRKLSPDVEPVVQATLYFGDGRDFFSGVLTPASLARKTVFLLFPGNQPGPPNNISRSGLQCFATRPNLFDFGFPDNRVSAGAKFLIGIDTRQHSCLCFMKSSRMRTCSKVSVGSF